MSTQKTLLGIVSGIAAGAIAGILYAPDTGKRTRAKIAVKAKDVKGKLEGNVNTLSDKASAGYIDLKAVGKEFIAKTKEEALKLKDEITSSKSDLVKKSKEELIKELKELKKQTA